MQRRSGPREDRTCEKALAYTTGDIRDEARLPPHPSTAATTTTAVTTPPSLRRGSCVRTYTRTSQVFITSGSWITAFAVGFSVLVLSTGYTAVVTTSLIEQSRTDIRSFAEGIDRGYSFCTVRAREIAKESGALQRARDRPAAWPAARKSQSPSRLGTWPPLRCSDPQLAFIRCLRTVQPAQAEPRRAL